MADMIMSTDKVMRLEGVPATWHNKETRFSAGIDKDTLIASVADYEIRCEHLVRESDGLQTGKVGVWGRNDTYYQDRSSKYNPVQPYEVLKIGYDMLAEIGTEPRMLGTLKDGAYIWMQSEPIADFSRLSGDNASVYMTIGCSWDGSYPFYGLPMLSEHVCWNTRPSLESIEGKKDARTFSFRNPDRDEILKPENIQAMRDAWAVQKVTFEKMIQMDDRLVKAQLDPSELLRGDLNRYAFLASNPSRIRQVVSWDESAGLDGLLNAAIKMDEWKALPTSQEKLDRKAKDILATITDGPGQDLESRENTAWGLFNGVTRFADHGRKDGDTNLLSVLTGGNTEQKMGAYVLAHAMANRVL